MKTQLRIMAILMGALVSGAAISVTTPTINVNPGTKAGTQGTGGQVIFNGSITDSSCNIDSASTSQTVDLANGPAPILPAQVLKPPKRLSISV